MTSPRYLCWRVKGLGGSHARTGPCPVNEATAQSLEKNHRGAGGAFPTYNTTMASAGWHHQQLQLVEKFCQDPKLS